MFTLIFLKGKFNRPETLVPFLQSNVGEWPLIRIDCVTPYKGTKDELADEVCRYLNTIVPELEVKYNLTQNSSTELTNKGSFVTFMVIQVHIAAKQ